MIQQDRYIHPTRTCKEARELIQFAARYNLEDMLQIISWKQYAKEPDDLSPSETSRVKDLLVPIVAYVQKYVMGKARTN